MDTTRMKRTALGFIGGMAILLGVLGGATGVAAGGAVTPSAPEPCDCSSGVASVGAHFAKSTVLAEQAGSGPAKNRVGPTAEVA